MYAILLKAGVSLDTYLNRKLYCFNPPNNDERPFMSFSPFKKGYYEVGFYGCREVKNAYIYKNSSKILEYCLKCGSSWVKIYESENKKEVVKMYRDLCKKHGRDKVRIVSEKHLHQIVNK